MSRHTVQPPIHFTLLLVASIPLVICACGGGSDAPDGDVEPPDASTDAGMPDVSRPDTGGSDTPMPVTDPSGCGDPPPAEEAFTFSTPDGLEDLLALELDSDGNLYVVTELFSPTAELPDGTTVSVDEGQNQLLLAFDASGSLSWSLAYGASYATRLALDESGDLFVVGTTIPGGLTVGTEHVSDRETEMFVLHVAASSGELDWAHVTDGGPLEGLALDPDGDGGVWAAGSRGSDIQVVHVDSAGSVMDSWTAGDAAGSDSGLRPSGMALDGEGGITLAGLAWGTITFGEETYETRKQDLFVARFGPDGTPRWSHVHGGEAFGSISHDEWADVIVGPDGSLYLFGSAERDADLGWGPLERRVGLLAKVALDGRFEWIAEMPRFDTQTEMGRMDVDADGNIYVVGTFTNSSSSTLRFRPGCPLPDPETCCGEDVFVASFTSEGRGRWSRLMNDVGLRWGRAIAVTPSGARIAAGGNDSGLTGTNTEPVAIELRSD